MLYESYERKIQKLANIKNLIHRFRILISVILVLCLGLLIAFMSVKGMPLGEISIPETVEYGNDYTVTAQSLFSKTSFEYSMDSSSWVEDKPTAPGKYEVRAVSSGSFGKKYSDSKPYTITKKTITLNLVDHEVEYGELPAITSMLVQGDYISEYEVEYASSGVVSTKMKIVSLTILNQKSEDVTSYYNFTFDEYDVTIQPRNITLTAKDYSKVYDGKSVQLDENPFTSDSLVSGDKIETTVKLQDLNGVEVTPIFAGTYKAAFDTTSTKIFNSQLNPIDPNYNVSYVDTNFTISRRSIYIGTPSIKKIYDGIELNNLDENSNPIYTVAEGTMTTGLVEGHSIVVVNNSLTSLNQVGSIENRIEVRILDENQNDVTENYNIIYNYGTLEITECSLEVTTYSQDYIYTGQDISYVEYEITQGSIIRGAYVRVNSYFIGRTVGEYENQIELAIYDENGRDITNQYEINYIYGKINIAKMAIEITSNTVYQEYDGNSISVQVESNVELPQGHRIELSQSLNVYEVSKVENVVEVSILNQRYEDVTSNFEISYIYGTLEIYPKSVIVSLEDVFLMYGDEIYYQTTNYIDSGLLYGANLTLDVQYKLDDEIVVPYNVNQYTIEVQDYAFNNETLAKNYSLSFETSTLTISPRTIVIAPKEQTLIYGEADQFVFPIDSYDVVGAYSILPTDTISVNIQPERTVLHVGTYNTQIVQVIYEDELDALNYNVVCQEGTLIVTPKAVTISLVNQTCIYGDSYLYPQDAYTLDTSLAYEDSIYISEVNYYTNGTEINNFISINPVGRYEIRIQSVGYITSGISEDYEFTFESAVIEVLPRPVDLYTTDYVKTYDKVNLNPQDLLTSISIPVLQGHNVTITDVSDAIYAGTYENEVTIEIYDNAGTEVTNNYLITAHFGTLTILPREVNFILPTQNVMYGNELEPIQVELLEGDFIEATAFSYQQNGNIVEAINVGDYQLFIESYRFIDSINENNYIVSTTTPSELRIIPRTISIQLSDQEVIYGEEILYPEDAYTVSGNNLVNGDVLQIQSVVYSNVDGILDPIHVGEYQIQLESYTFSEIEDYGNYTIESIEPATLTIVKRKIEIQPNNVSITYGESISIWDFTWSVQSSTGFAYQDEMYAYVNSATYYNQSGLVYSVRNVGTYFFEIELRFINSILDGDYEITSSRGTLEVLKRNLSITPIDQSVIYGNEIEYSNTEFTQEGLAYSDSIQIVEVEYRVGGVVVTPRNVGEYQIYIKEIAFTQSGIENNYTIEPLDQTYAILTITPRAIMVAARDQSITYGEDYTELNMDYVMVVGRIITSDQPYFRINEVSYSQDGVSVTPRNVGLYTINIISAGFTTEELQSNYNVQLANVGILEITRRALQVWLEDDSVVYGEFSNYVYQGDIITRDGDLVYGDKIIDGSYRFYFNGLEVTPYNAGIYELLLTDYVFEDETVSVNYIIECLSARFEITKRTLTIQTLSSSSIYGDDINYRFESYNLVTGDYPVADEAEYYINNTLVDAQNVGIYRYRITNVSFVDMVDNYNYEIVYASTSASYEILAREITVAATDQTIVYGEDYTYPETQYEVVIGDILTRDQEYFRILEVSYLQNRVNVTPQNVGFYIIRIESAGFITEELQANYNVNFANVGMLEIIKRNIQVWLENDTIVYGDFSDYVYQGEIITRENDLVYGDKIIDGSYAFYQYGSEVTPHDATVYQMALTEVVFEDDLDIENYSITYIESTFTITQRPLIVQTLPSSSIYGSSFHYQFETYNLVSGDYPVGDMAEYYVNDTLVDAQNVGIYNYRVTRIVFSDFIDNYNYEIEYASTLASYEIFKREITVAAANRIITYGDDFTYPEIEYQVTAGDIIARDRDYFRITDVSYLQGGIEVTPQNVGFYITKINSAGFITEELQANYDVELINIGLLEIEQRALHVWLEDDSVVYGGFSNYVYQGEFITRDGDLVYGDKIIDGSYAFYLSESEVTPYNVGTYQMRLTDVVFENEADKENYVITYLYSTFEITKRRLTIQTIDSSTVYGSSSSNYQFEAYNLVSGDTPIAIAANYYVDSILTEAHNVGTYKYRITIITFAEASDSNNYQIVYSTTLANYEILAREITITARSQASIYGNDYTYPETQYEVLVGSILDDDEEYFRINEVRYLQNGVEVPPHNAGIYFIETVSYGFTQSILNQNYLITVEDEAILTIHQREVEISLSNVTIEYGEFESYIYPLEYEIVSGEFVYQENLTIESVLYLQSGIEVTPHNVGVYSVDLDGYSFNNPESKMNYAITVTSGTLAITRKAITIRIEDQTKVYGEQVSSIYDSSFVVDGLVYDDTVDYLSVRYSQGGITVQPKNIGEYTIRISDVWFETSNSNYTWTGSTATLVITQKEVTVIARDQFVFFGERIIFDRYAYTFSSESTILDEDLSYFTIEELAYLLDGVEVTPYEAGIYNISIRSFICSDETIAANYQLTFEDTATLTIQSKEVEIVLYDQEIIYGEFETFVYPLDYQIVSGTFLANETITIESILYLQNGVEVTPRNVGTYDVQIETYVLSNPDSMKNYEIILLTSELVIKKKDLYLQLEDQDLIYGDEISYPHTAFTADGIAYETDEIDTINVLYLQNGAYCIPKYVGTYEIEALSIQMTNQAEDNYTLIATNSVLTIGAKTLDNTALLFEISDVYGTDYTNFSQEIDSYIQYELPYQDQIHILNYRIQNNLLEYVDRIHNAGAYAILVDNLSILSQEGQDITSNYILEDVYTASVEITKKSVTISPTGILDQEYDGSIVELPTTVEGSDEFVGDDFETFTFGFEIIYNNVPSLVVQNAGDYIYRMSIVSSSDEIMANYEITIEDSTFRIEAKQIDVSFNPIEDRVYDGAVYTPYENTEAYNAQTGVVDETLVLEYQIFYSADDTTYRLVEEIKNVGYYYLNYSGGYVVGGQALISNYSFAVQPEEFRITPLRIMIQTSSIEVTYDGVYHNSMDYTYQFIDSSSMDITLDLVDYTHEMFAGTYDNMLEFEIYYNQEEVTSNFDITYDLGSIVILQRVIKIETSSATMEYAGRKYPLESTDYEVTLGSLVDGHIFHVTQNTKLYSVGTVDNEITIRILNSLSRNMTSNYDIQYIYGTLTLTSKAVSVDTTNCTTTYNGTDVDLDSMCLTTSGVISGETVSGIYQYVLNGQVVDRIKDVGVYTVTIQGIEMYYSRINTTENYDVTYLNSTFEVTVLPKEIEFISEDGTFFYNNQYQSEFGYIVKDGLCGDDLVVIDEAQSSKILYPGEMSNVLVFTIVDPEGNDVTSCYSITYTYGTLRIEDEFQLIASESKVYDGTTETLTQVQAAVKDANGVTAKGITAILYIEPLEVSIPQVYSIALEDILGYEIIFDSTLGLSEDEEAEVLSMLTFEIISAEYTITKRSIYIKPESVNKIYDGTELKATGIEYVDTTLLNTQGYELISTHTIQIETSEILTTVATKMNQILSVVILDENQIDVTEYYNVTYEYQAQENTAEERKKENLFKSKIQIKKRSIYISSGSSEATFTGEKLYNLEYSIDLIENTYEDQGLLPGHIFVLDVENPFYILQGEKANRVQFKILDENGEDVTSSYGSKWDYAGVLKVNPVAITITTNSETKAYDGIPLIGSSLTITGLPDGITYEIKEDSFAAIDVVGEVLNEIKINNIVFYNREGEVVGSKAFDITFEYGVLTITK